MNLTVSVALLHAAVLIQGRDEPGRHPAQLQMLWAVQLAAYQRILSS